MLSTAWNTNIGNVKSSKGLSSVLFISDKIYWAPRYYVKYWKIQHIICRQRIYSLVSWGWWVLKITCKIVYVSGVCVYVCVYTCTFFFWEERYYLQDSPKVQWPPKILNSCVQYRVDSQSYKRDPNKGLFLTLVLQLPTWCLGLSYVLRWSLAEDFTRKRKMVLRIRRKF